MSESGRITILFLLSEFFERIVADSVLPGLIRFYPEKYTWPHLAIYSDIFGWNILVSFFQIAEWYLYAQVGTIFQIITTFDEHRDDGRFYFHTTDIHLGAGHVDV